MAPAIFPAVEPGSAVFPQLQRLREQITSDPPCRWTLTRRCRRSSTPAAGAPATCAWGGSTGRSSARIRRWKTGVSRTYDFPDDPLMDWLHQDDGPLLCHGDEAGVQVLRYIPLRRVTFLLRDGAGLPARVIAKTKAQPGLLRATRALVATHKAAVAAATGAGAGALTVPRPVRLDTRRRLVYLEELPGRPLDEVLPQIGVAEGMSRLGALHRRLQELPVRGLRVRKDTGDWLAEAGVAVTQVGFLAPSAAGQAQALYDELVRAAPGDGEQLFCHGDFVPGQILCHSSGWSVMDLDDGHYADPLAEAAALYAVLPHDLCLAAGAGELARQTYLDAYLRQAGRPLDTGRWQWFLAVAELLLLARRTIRGRALPGEAQTVLERIRPVSGPAP